MNFSIRLYAVKFKRTYNERKSTKSLSPSKNQILGSTQIWNGTIN